MGLGILLTSGYLSAAGVLYCPSSNNMPPDDSNPDTERGSFTLGHWKAAGGETGETLLGGAWQRPRGGVHSATRGGDVNNVYSHYAYRDTWCYVMYGSFGPRNFGTWTADDEDVWQIPGIKPRLNVRLGQPVFRTDRELGPRALVADTFSKGGAYDVNGKDVSGTASLDGTRDVLGFGVRGHASVYNVVYGDGHVKAYTDPNLRIVHHTQGYGNVGVCDTIGVLSQNAFYAGDGSPAAGWKLLGSDVNGSQFAHTGLAVWHDLDVAQGVDVP